VLAILDIDGTLVDTNYHHVIAWFRAFREHDLTLALWRIHRHIGMGGDQLVAALTDEQTERSIGDSIRSAEKRLYGELIGEVQTMSGSSELISELERRGHSIVFASSAKSDEVDVYLNLLGARDQASAWTTSADVEATKPAPDLVNAALEKVRAEPGESILIGDTPWDVEAALRADVRTIAVLTGGFAAQELRDAGAAAIFESVQELCAELDDTELR
jgi:HAD superfamily hydrolase (TIGR01509 family)